MKGTTTSEVIIIGCLLLVQVIFAGNSILMSYLMSLGFAPLTVVIFLAAPSFLVISPAAYFQERTKWPTKFSLKLLVQVVLIAFSGVLLFQTLYLEGLKQTSPAIATAMPNLAPGLIFLIAWAFGFEKLDVGSVHGKAKIMGTIACVLGAVAMSLMHSPRLKSSDPWVAIEVDKQWIIGCSYLFAAVFVLSCNVVLQAATLVDFPAPLSLCAVTSLIGAALAAVVQFLEDPSQLLPIVNSTILWYFLLGGIVGAFVVSVNGWALKKRGPVFVSIFSPVSTVLSIMFSAYTLGDTLSTESLGGMLFIFVGLYLVLWSQKEQAFKIEDTEEDLECNADCKEPLISAL